MSLSPRSLDVTSRKNPSPSSPAPTPAPFALLDLAPAEVEMEERADGSRILRSPRALEPYAPHLGALLRRAAARPEALFLAERRADGGWRKLSWAAALAMAEAIGQGLVERGLDGARPVMILSGNSIDHALLTLGAMLVGVPVAPVSPAYSLLSTDHAKLRHVAELVRPAVVYVDDAVLFGPALASLGRDGDFEVVASHGHGDSVTPFGDLLATAPGAEQRDAEARVGPDTVAKILFTSGSTGVPKGVLNTHRMLCSNQQMIAQCWPFLAEEPPVLVDWLPWNHTFGANHNFNLVLRHGGTLYIDGGKPQPGKIEETVRNLREISPTLYFNVPAGFAQLLPFLERDAELRASFFRRLKMIFYAAAALPQDLWQRLEALSIAERGERVLMTSAWGSTETSPMATTVHWPIERAGVIGLPAPGVEIKMVPSGGKMELRVRGPMVTPGYVGREDLTAAAFDDEGFYKIGDAGRLADPGDPSKGLVFDGRVSEDFKLLTGTWVSVGSLRVEALAAAAPALSDAVVTGHDRDRIGLLAWIDPRACAEIAGDPGLVDDSESLCRHPAVIEHVRRGLARHNAERPASSTRVARILLMSEPPSIDAGEITDKGYINQRAALERRHALVERLHAEPVAPAVIEI